MAGRGPRLVQNVDDAIADLQNTRCFCARIDHESYYVHSPNDVCQASGARTRSFGVCEPGRASFRRRLSSRGSFTAENSYGRSVTGKPTRTIISTLDPAKVQRTDLLDLKGQYQYAVTFPGSEERRPVQLHYFTERLGKVLPFPDGSRGFLYYDIETRSVRFRVRRATDGASDLLLPDGSPWLVPLREIKLKDGTYDILCQQLERDEFISSTGSFSPSTFDPDLLQSRDHIVIKSKTLSVWVPCKYPQKITIVYDTPPAAFPFGSRGFLYYRAGSTPVGGGLRFRLAANLDEVAHGTDLAMPSGVPWFIPLAHIVSQVKYAPLLEELLRAGLVTAQAVESLRKSLVKRIAPERTLFELGQIFAVDFSSKVITKTVVGVDATIGEFSLQKIFMSHDDDNGGVCAFTGSGLLRFERSEVSQGKRVLRLRIVKITDPVQCVVPGYRAEEFRRGVVEPRAGELLQNWRSRDGEQRLEPWGVDVDDNKCSTNGLKLLWDL